MTEPLHVDLTIPVSAREICHVLRRNGEDREHKSWLIDLLSNLDDKSYEIVCNFVKDNP